VYHKKKPDSVKNLYEPIETSASLLQENATIGRLRSIRIVSLPPIIWVLNMSFRLRRAWKTQHP